VDLNEALTFRCPMSKVDIQLVLKVEGVQKFSSFGCEKK
jgi:hypothetical protein